MPRLYERLGLPGKKLLRERWRSIGAVPNPHPLFVFGNQKSGTTAVAGLLAAATGKRVTLDFAGASQPYIGRLLRGETALDVFVARNRWAFSNDIIKEPNLTFLAPALMEHFASPRAAFVIREPADNIRSILDRVRLKGDLPTLDIGRIKANSTWQGILSGHDLGLPKDHYIATLARRWLRAAEIFQSAPMRFELIRYDEFRADRTGTIARLAQSLGLAVTADIAAIENRQYQKRGTQRDPREFFGEENLARIDAICGEAARSLGLSR